MSAHLLAALALASLVGVAWLAAWALAELRVRREQRRAGVRGAWGWPLTNVRDLYALYRSWGAGRLRAAWDALDTARSAWLYDRALRAGVRKEAR